jgi:hypothetical protein
MKQLFIFTFFIVLLFSQSGCQEIICKGYECFSPPLNVVTCQITDKKGNDLLNPSVLGHFDTSKIQVFSVSSTRKKLLSHSFDTLQKPIRLNIDLTLTFISIGADNQINIELDSSNVDVLKYAIQSVRSKCCTYSEYTKKSINDKEVDKNAIFSIVK